VLTTVPRFDRPFILTTNSSITGLAYILTQKDKTGRQQVGSYGERRVRPAESRWTLTELEMLAVVEWAKHVHTYLAGDEFEIFTDHVSLKLIQNTKTFREQLISSLGYIYATVQISHKLQKGLPYDIS